MNYDLIIIKLTKPHLKQVIAHHIAADPSISLQKAISLLDNLPLVYKRDLSFKELEETTLHLNKLGAVCTAVESKNPLDKIKRDRGNCEDGMAVRSQQKDAQGRSYIENGGKAGKVSDKVYRTGSGKKIRGGKIYKWLFGSIIISLFLLFAVVVIVILFRGRKNSIQDAPSLLSKRSSIQYKSGKEGEDERRGDEGIPAKGRVHTNGRKTTDKPENRSSDTYADSAASSCSDYECAVKLYKIAISFNRYNVRAWQGLVAAYRGAAKWAEAEDAEAQMKEIFGGDAFTIKEIVKPYGILTQYQRDDNGVCRIEYRSSSSGRSAIERETFYITRALAAQQECQVISLYASTGKGTGMLVRIKTEGFPTRVSDYRDRASLLFTE